MTRKVYRTAQGKMVDLGALQLRNENVRAVGNMNVNARGDLIDSQNRPIRTRNDQVGKQYKKQTTNVTDTPVTSSRRSQKSAPVDIPAPPEDFFDDFEKASQAPVAAPTSGLAAAIARAREIKQEPISPSTSTTTIKKL